MTMERVPLAGCNCRRTTIGHLSVGRSVGRSSTNRSNRIQDCTHYLRLYVVESSMGSTGG